MLTLLYLLGFAGIAWLGLRGASYYLTPLVDRPHHPDYWIYKPGGRMGLTYAFAGTLAMLLMHLYSLRKRVRWLRRLGHLGGWLDFHILLGIFGPLLILLHTSFKFRGLVSISFWSMVVVALSGLIGRFLYLQLPRTRQGEELSLADAESEHRLLVSRLRERFGVRDIDLLSEDGAADLGSLRLLGKLLFEPLALRRVLGVRSRREWRHLPAANRSRLVRLVLREAALRRRILFWDRLHGLFHYWHVFHRPFAFLLYVFLAVHVSVAWYTGYGGLFRP